MFNYWLVCEHRSRLKSVSRTEKIYEYKRQGTRNLFVFAEPKAGQRHILVTQRRTKEDFAKAIRYLGDDLYPDAPLIDVVLDNLNTHHYHSLVEFFGKVEADRIMARLCFYFTPPHASWLNMAEIEISVMSQQCLDRRLPDEWSLIMELFVWEQTSNQLARKINWPSPLMMPNGSLLSELLTQT